MPKLGTTIGCTRRAETLCDDLLDYEERAPVAREKSEHVKLPVCMNRISQEEELSLAK